MDATHPNAGVTAGAGLDFPAAGLEERVRELAGEVRALRQDLAQLRALVPPRRSARPPRPPRMPLKYWIRHQIKTRFGLVSQIGKLEYGVPPKPVYVPRWYHRKPLVVNPPLISIATPSYNQGEYLEHTIRSVLDQEYPWIEYVVQDGGSTDSTRDVLARYRMRLHRCESRRDRGQSHAINLGFAGTAGEIMAYLNSDDLLLPGALYYVAAYFEKHPDVDVVYGHRVVIDSAGQELGRWVLPKHDAEVLKWADYIPQETLFWRRRIWDKVGGIDESFRFAMDWDLLLRFQEAGAKIVRLPRFLGAFRVHQSSKTVSTVNSTGLQEMERLRRRSFGRDVSYPEVVAAVRSYMCWHVFHNRMYRLGLFRY